MPMIFLTQAEQQQLQHLLKNSLALLEYESGDCRDMIRQIANKSYNFGWSDKKKRFMQKALHGIITSNNKKIAKRVSLLKKINHPERTVL